MDPVSSADVFLFDKFRFDRRGRGLFYVDGTAPVAVGSRALDVLDVLIERVGDLVPKHEIMEAVWPETTVEEANLTVQISTLRRVLDNGRSETSCIQTIPGRGYRFVGEVIKKDTNARSDVETRELRNVRTAPRLSIVVLPFTSLSDDRNQQYFADGIIEDLTSDLSSIADMFVISCNTAFTYRNRSVDTKQIGRELGVRYVLEGSIRRSGNQLRVTAQLIDAETDAHLWVERFDGDISDLFALQDEVARRIAVALNLELPAVEAARPTDNPDALDRLFRARAAFLKPKSPESYAERVSLWEHALAHDPQSTEAQSRLAIVLTGRVMDNMTGSPGSDVARAEILAKKVLEVSPRSPVAHMAKGQVLRAQGRYAEAIPEYETVLAFNRNWVSALHHLGQCKLLTGSMAEIIPLAEQAIQLSPRDPDLGMFFLLIGRVHLLQSRVQEAIFWLEKARAAIPTHSHYRAWIAAAFALNDDIERAAAELFEARRLSSDNRFSSITALKDASYWGVPSILALHEATYFAGLRKAGMPDE